MKRQVSALAVFALFVLALGPGVSSTSLTLREFERLALELSESSSYFDTDNLISNETSYQHVIPLLQKQSRRGGAYLGVGPDQNFTYIAQIRPEIAFIIDIRRDNQLLHLYFKRLFEESQNRWDFLSRLFGKPLPADYEASETAGAEELVRYFEAAGSSLSFFDTNFDRVFAALRRNFPRLIGEEDRSRLHQMIESFFRLDLQLRFRSHGRSPRFYYPTLGELILAADLAGKRWNYLEREPTFQRVRQMQLENRIVPLVGDFAGEKTIRSVAANLTGRNLVVSAFYVSNVEFYLFRDGKFEDFLRNVESLPIDSRSLFIRSYFRYGLRHPASAQGSLVTSFLQPMKDFLEQHQRRPYSGYWDLMTRSYLPLEETG